MVRRRFRDVFADRQKYANITFISEPLHSTSDGLMLDNGQVQRLDTVILYTGYSLDFPFITPECGVQYTLTRAWPLYRHMINCDHPTIRWLYPERHSRDAGCRVSSAVLQGMAGWCLHFAVFARNEGPLSSGLCGKPDGGNERA